MPIIVSIIRCDMRQMRYWIFLDISEFSSKYTKYIQTCIDLRYINQCIVYYIDLKFIFYVILHDVSIFPLKNIKTESMSCLFIKNLGHFS